MAQPATRYVGLEMLLLDADAPALAMLANVDMPTPRDLASDPEPPLPSRLPALTALAAAAREGEWPLLQAVAATHAGTPRDASHAAAAASASSSSSGAPFGHMHFLGLLLEAASAGDRPLLRALQFAAASPRAAPPPAASHNADAATAAATTPASPSGEASTYPLLALLGVDHSNPALTTLQAMVSPEQYRLAAAASNPAEQQQGFVLAPASAHGNGTDSQTPSRQRTDDCDTTLSPSAISAAGFNTTLHSEASPAANDHGGALVVAGVEVSVSPGRTRHAPPALPPVKAPRTMFDIGRGNATREATGLPVEDADLRALFHSYDREGTGFIARSEFKVLYSEFESYGLQQTEKQVDELFARAWRTGHRRGSDDKLYFEEFAVLMLHLSKL